MNKVIITILAILIISPFFFMSKKSKGEIEQEAIIFIENFSQDTLRFNQELNEEYFEWLSNHLGEKYFGYMNDLVFDTKYHFIIFMKKLNDLGNFKWEKFLVKRCKTEVIDENNIFAHLEIDFSIRYDDKLVQGTKYCVIHLQKQDGIFKIVSDSGNITGNV